MVNIIIIKRKKSKLNYLKRMFMFSTAWPNQVDIQTDQDTQIDTIQSSVFEEFCSLFFLIRIEIFAFRHHPKNILTKPAFSKQRNHPKQKLKNNALNINHNDWFSIVATWRSWLLKISTNILAEYYFLVRTFIHHTMLTASMKYTKQIITRH